MGKFQLSPENKKKLHEIAQKQAEKIAKEFEETMSKKYESVLDWYYNEPYQTNPPHYERTYNLKKSYLSYFSSSTSRVIGGIEITGENMSDYGMYSKISGEDYLNKFYFNQLGTWHGGDWHGGYGVPSGFSTYNEMVNFYKVTIKDIRKKYGI